MRRIRYAGGTFITGDAEASVICDYAASLANSGHAAIVSLPALDEDGQEAGVEMVIGPASQVFSEDVRWDADPPDTGDFVTRTQGEIAQLQWRPPTGSLLDDWEL